MSNILFLAAVMALQACAINRAASDNQLDFRADYSGDKASDAASKDAAKNLLKPHRLEPVIADIWIHAKELPNGDYFQGAWIRTLVKPGRWVIPAEAPKIIPQKEGDKR